MMKRAMMSLWAAGALGAASTLALIPAGCAADAPSPSQPDADLAVDILKEIVALRTAKGYGQTPAMAEALAARLKSAGFSDDDIDMPSMEIDGEQVSALVVRYKGDGDEAPIALLAHMDVVDANPDTWGTEPFTPTVKDGYLYGRGAVDNKAGIGALITTFMRLKREGWTPDRDLVIAFSADEETGMQTTRMLTQHEWVRDAEFALNSDAGTGSVAPDGSDPTFSIQSAEKTYATYFVTARNTGGHSSAPRPDNALFDIAGAIKAIEALRFPVEFNDITRSMTRNLAETQEPAVRDALLTLLETPDDAEARLVVEQSDARAHFLSTTCAPTMLSAGSAENALPQRAMLTVNCRIMPGTSPAAVQEVLERTIDNDAIDIELNGEPVESPVSPVREDLFASIEAAVKIHHPDAKIQPTMSSGGTDGREFRRAGIPTYGAGSITLIRPTDFRAHGIDERAPLETYKNQLVFWETLFKDIAGDA